MATSVTALPTRKPTGRPSWPLILLAGDAKTGKAQPLHSRIATPTGWTTMGQIQAGDLVIGSDGSPVTVTSVHDRGVRPIYRVTFSDGAAVEACDEHLWATWHASSLHRYHNKGPRKGERNIRPATIRTTEQIREMVLSGTRVHIPVVGPVQYAPSGSQLPIDPYTLGLLLGDGCLAKPSYPYFSSGDAELFESLAKAIPSGDTLTPFKCGVTVGIKGGRTTAKLRDLKLMGASSETKFIPSEYLTATASDRLALLQGLMDTDGGLEQLSITYTTVSPQLAVDVQVLVRSLGGTCSMSSKSTSYVNADGDRVACKTAYRLRLRLPIKVNPFRLGRKAERWQETRPTKNMPPRRTVRSVDYVGEMPARCIAVDAADHLYLTDDFVVTHNTFTAAQLTGDERIGRALWIDLGEGCADEYGAVPGADYEIIEHDGTWVDIVTKVALAKEVAKEELAGGHPPTLLVIDSMTAEWAMLTEWTNTRAKRSRNNRKLLSENPDAEIDISSNYWNDANSRHNRLMNILKTFPGIVVMTSLETEKTQIGPGGRPVENAPKVAKPDAQKRLPADATVWIRLSLTEAPVIVGIRSVKVHIRPGIDKPKPIVDFDLGDLIFEKMGIQSGSAQARNMPALDADQVADGEEQESPRPAAAPASPARQALLDWEAEIEKCGNDRAKLLDLYNQAPAGEVKNRILKLGKELKAKEDAAAQSKPVAAEPTPAVVDGEVVKESTSEPAAETVAIENPTQAKLFDALLDASSWSQVEAISKQITSNVKFARADVSVWLKTQPIMARLLEVNLGEPLTLSEMSSLVDIYVDDKGHSLNDGIDGSTAAVA